MRVVPKREVRGRVKKVKGKWLGFEWEEEE